MLNTQKKLYVKWDVYYCLYRIVLLHYFSINKYRKLQYQSIDSTFIKNLHCEDIYGRNVRYKSKNGISLSVITDINGVHVNVVIAAANVHDHKIAIAQQM